MSTLRLRRFLWKGILMAVKCFNLLSDLVRTNYKCRNASIKKAGLTWVLIFTGSI